MSTASVSSSASSSAVPSVSVSAPSPAEDGKPVTRNPAGEQIIRAPRYTFVIPDFSSLPDTQSAQAQDKENTEDWAKTIGELCGTDGRLSPKTPATPPPPPSPVTAKSAAAAGGAVRRRRLLFEEDYVEEQILSGRTDVSEQDLRREAARMVFE